MNGPAGRLGGSSTTVASQTRPRRALWAGAVTAAVWVLTSTCLGPGTGFGIAMLVGIAVVGFLLRDAYPPFLVASVATIGLPISLVVVWAS